MCTCLYETDKDKFYYSISKFLQILFIDKRIGGHPLIIAYTRRVQKWPSGSKCWQALIFTTSSHKY